MATYSTYLKLLKPAQGENSPAWASTFNAGATELSDDAIDGLQDINLASSTSYSLAAMTSGADTETRARTLRFTGTPASAVTVTVPASVTSKHYTVINNCGQTLTLKYAATTGRDFANGAIGEVYCDGVTVLQTNALTERTAAELAAGVTPTAYQYASGYFRRYGAVGDNSTNDWTALANALLVGAQGVKLFGMPGDVYLYTSALTLGAYVDIDLQGATLKPSGNILSLNSQISATATTSYSGAIASGQRAFVVTSATGVATGQWVQFQVTTATEEASAYPPSWARVTNVAGTTITVDRAFQVDYPAAPTTPTVNFYNDALFGTRCNIKNGIIDGAASTYSGGTIGIAARISGFKDVLLENLKLTGWSTTLGDDLLVTFLCIKSRANNIYAYDVTCGSQIVNLVDSMDASVTDSTIDGSAFGVAITRADSAAVINNTLIGRKRFETDTAVSARSTRGIKFYGCKFARCIGNHATDYETPIRMQGVWRYIIANNTCINADQGNSYAGQLALAVTNQVNGTITDGGVISGNIIENAAGVGIGVSSSTGTGRVTITANQIRNIQGIAIYTNCRNSIITNNQIYNWGLRNSADEGIYHDSGTTCTGNRFYHDTILTLPCIRATLVSNFWYTFRDNISVSTNPLFTGTLDVIKVGATTIASGATSQTPTHSLIKTPTASEILITPATKPTNSPRMHYVDTITSTQFTVRVDADPGASGIVLNWRAELNQPFKA